MLEWVHPDNATLEPPAVASFYEQFRRLTDAAINSDRFMYRRFAIDVNGKYWHEEWASRPQPAQRTRPKSRASLISRAINVFAHGNSIFCSR